jgi:predicted glutamine amidotransferase
MIAAPLGLSCDCAIDPFLRMAQGRNALNELNTRFGKITHGDGWGAVYEQEGELTVRRSTCACWKDPSLEEPRGRRVLLLHARRKSSGRVLLEDTHPFEAEVDGARWFFSHNGTVNEDLPTPSAPMKGTTDSEQLFRLLLPFLREDRILEGFRAVYGGIRDFTSLNTFLLGPNALWAVGLYTQNPTYYTLTLTETEDGPIISSEPLPEMAGKQTRLPSGTVLRIDRRTGAIEWNALGEASPSEIRLNLDS